MGHDLDEFAAYASNSPAPTGGPGPAHDLDEFAQYAQAPAAPVDNRGFFEKAKDSIASGAHDLYSVGKDVVTHPIDTVTDPAKRRQFERGVDSMVTLGYGQKLAGAVGRALGDTPDVDLQATEAADQAKAPEYRTAGATVGAFIPGAASTIGKVAGKAVAPIADSLILKGAGVATEQAVARVPWLGKILAPAVPIAGAAAKGVLGYESVAPATAALSASASGHRLEAAREAATDPAGLLLSGAIPAASEAVERGATGASNYVSKAEKNADEWLVNDVVGEKRGESTPTARKHLAGDGEDVKNLLKEDPQLRAVVGEARHSDRKVLTEASDLVRERLQDVSQPHAQLYQQVDAALPAGGARSGDVVDGFKKAAKAQRKDGTSSGEAKARELDKQAALLERADDWGGNSKIYNPDKPIGNEGTVGQAVEALENSRATNPAQVKMIDDEIARLKDSATTIGYNPDTIVPIAALRKVTSDVQSSAYDGLGGLASTKAHGLSVEVSRDAKKILDGYLDEAGKKVPETVKQIKEMNWRISALANIQKVVDQRLNNAIVNATGTGTPAGLKAGLSKLTHSSVPLAAAELALHGHPIIAAAGVAALAAPKLKRFADTKIAANAVALDRALVKLTKAVRSGAPVQKAIADAVASGVGVEAARRIAERYGRK